MAKWLKDRFKIIKLTLQNQKLIVVFGILQVFKLGLDLVSPAKINTRLLEISAWMPWYGWVIGWFVLLWFASIEYAFERKEVFDQTSLAFFKAFLDFLINDGNNLFNHSEDKDFYSRIKFWQHQVIQGIALGLGPEESEKYFQKVDSESPVMEAYRESLTLKTNEPLCKALQANLEELKLIRFNLTETKKYEQGELETVKKINLANGSNPEQGEKSTALQIRK